MKGLTKMLMMNREKRNERGYDYDSFSHEYYPRDDWGAWIEGRFRDDRGREHYDNGRYAPMRNEYMPPVYREHHENDGRYRPMNKIGFSAEENYNRPQIERNYRSDASHKDFAEMDYGRYGKMTSGYASGAPVSFNKKMAEEWVSEMQNEDGSTGGHWSLDQVKQLISQKGLDCDPLKLWVAMNAEYSDRCAVNKKHGVNTIDFYLDSAIAFWLKDKDAVPDKLAEYYENIVE